MLVTYSNPDNESSVDASTKFCLGYCNFFAYICYQEYLELRDAQFHFNAGTKKVIFIDIIYQKQNYYKFLIKTKRLLQIKRKQIPQII